MSLKHLKNKFNKQLSCYFKEYSKTKQPISVKFRDIVSDLEHPERATHLIHSYPAKLLVHIPHFFINNSILSQPGDTILDPFCGSGTVLLEAILANRNAFGSDANPLARLITKVKVTKYEVPKLRSIKNKLSSAYITADNPLPDVVNIDYWFMKDVQNELNKLLSAIEEISDVNYRDFFWVCLSQCVKRVSFSDPRISVPVKLRRDKYPLESVHQKKINTLLDNIEKADVRKKFFEIVDDNIKRVAQTADICDYINMAEVISSDARDLSSINKIDNSTVPSKDKIDLIISSPPYVGAQKYIRASSLNIGWLKLSQASGIKLLDQQSIGREHFSKTQCSKLQETGIEQADEQLNEIFKINPKRANIASTYLNEMESAINESIRVLKPDGYMVFIVGNNEICGKEFDTQKYLQYIIEKKNVKLKLKLIDDIKSRGLMTKRNKTASMITREWIMVFKK